MLTTSLEIVNRLGLHARAAAKFVTLAGRFESSIELELGGQTANGKSIMAVMMLAARQGVTLQMRVSGADEEDAVRQLLRLVAERFGEEE